MASRVHLVYGGAILKYSDVFDAVERSYDEEKWLCRIHVGLFRALLAWRLLCHLEKKILDLDTRRVYTLVLQALQGRSTSKQKDEAFCLCSFFAVSANSILDSEDDDKMRVFWELQSEVPEEIIFALQERLAIPGYRWAPSSFLSWATGGLKAVDCPTARRDADGLHVEFPGLFLQPLRGIRAKWFPIIIASGDIFLLSSIYARTGYDIQYPALIHRHGFREQWLEDYGTGWVALVSLKRPYSSESDHEICAEFIGILTMSVERHPLAKESPLLVKAELTEGSQAWLIS